MNGPQPDFLTKSASQLVAYGAGTAYPLGLESGFKFMAESGWEFLCVVPPFGPNAEPVFVFAQTPETQTNLIV